MRDEGEMMSAESGKRFKPYPTYKDSGDEWYRMDLVFFHRHLRCLVIIDLKIGKFTHADAGQMHLYLNYARERRP